MDLADFPYASANLSIWSTLEPTLGILNGFLPVLRPIGSFVSELPVFIWAESSFRSLRTRKGDRSTGSTEASLGTSSKGPKFKRPADSTDQLYQLDTIHLVRNESREGCP